MNTILEYLQKKRIVAHNNFELKILEIDDSMRKFVRYGKHGDSIPGIDTGVLVSMTWGSKSWCMGLLEGRIQSLDKSKTSGASALVTLNSCRDLSINAKYITKKLRDEIIQIADKHNIAYDCINTEADFCSIGIDNDNGIKLITDEYMQFFTEVGELLRINDII